MNTIYVIDTGLSKLTGHHYNQALGLIHGAHELGYTSVILSAAKAKEDAQICAISIPTFEKVLYRLDPFAAIEAHATYLANEIHTHLPTLDESDVLLFPNANYDEIVAAGLFNQRRQLQIPIIVRLIYYPADHEPEYLACLASLRPYPNIRLVTSSVPYSQWLARCGFANRFIGGPPHRLPFALATTTTPIYAFAYLGQAANVKGFEHLINALLVGAQQGFLPPTLIHSANYEFPTDLRNALPHVTVIDKPVSETQFYEHICSSQCILAYYDPANYRLGDSAIVTEALALGRLILSSALPFIRETYGEEFFHFSCTPDEYHVMALLDKMRWMQAQTLLPKSVIRAQQKAKFLTSPTVFLNKALE